MCPSLAKFASLVEPRLKFSCIASLASKSIVSLASLVPQKDFSACFANQLNFRLGSTKVPLILPNKDTTYHKRFHEKK